MIGMMACSMCSWGGGGSNEALSLFLSVFLTVSHLQSFSLLISRNCNFRQQSVKASAALCPSRARSSYWDISSSAGLVFCSVTGKLWKHTHTNKYSRELEAL